MNRAILARINAKKAQVADVAEKLPEKKIAVKIAMRDPETNEVVEEFESIEQAVEKGFNLPNLVGAIKNGNKYKGHLWTAENQ